MCAEFRNYPDVPVLVPSVTPLEDWITNYHHLLQETSHVSLPFITTGPATTDSACPRDIKILNQSGPVFLWILLTLELSTSEGKSKHLSLCII